MGEAIRNGENPVQPMDKKVQEVWQKESLRESEKTKTETEANHLLMSVGFDEQPKSPKKTYCTTVSRVLASLESLQFRLSLCNYLMLRRESLLRSQGWCFITRSDKPESGNRFHHWDNLHAFRFIPKWLAPQIPHNRASSTHSF